MKNIHQHIIDKCLQGNERAQLELYELYATAMYNTCLRMVGNAADAQDVMQDAFIKAFDKLETYSKDVAFGAWLKKIMVNQSLDFLKSAKLNFDDIDQLADDYEDSGGDSSYGEVDVAKLKQAIMGLANRQRIVISLYLLEGYDHDEIAEILDITAANSAILLSRAKTNLRKAITSEQLMA